MSNRSTAAVLNAFIWGAGYLYSGRGKTGILAALANMSLYLWIYLLGLNAWLLWAPILLPGSLYFAIDGYKSAQSLKFRTSTGSAKSKEQLTSTRVKYCKNCGAQLSDAKYCPECGAQQG